MTLEQALVTKLLADAGLTALIGTRLYPDDGIPQKKPGDQVWPVLTYRQQGSDPTHYLTGGRSDIERDVYLLTAHGPRRDTLTPVRDYLRGMLSGTAARGTWGGVGGVAVRGCLVADVYADDQPPEDGSEKRPRTLRVTLTIIWKR